MTRLINQAKVKTATFYTYQNVITNTFRLSNQAQTNSLNNSTSLEEFQQLTGLADLSWQTLHYQIPGQEKSVSQAITEAEGFVFFMHGWNGSHRIWEKLPLRLTAKHKNIVCFNLDVNGFGMSPFISPPNPKQCSPAALMTAVEYWLTAANLFPAHHYRSKKPFYLFVGHSMSAAALFYKDVSNWQRETYGFYALAPALFCNDTQRKTFFKTVGASIRLPTLAAVKDALAPHIIDMLGSGASAEVKDEHLRIYNQTSFGTIAQTLYVLGTTSTPPHQNNWSMYKIALGHKDRVVGLDHMLNLLAELGLQSDQIRVTLGDHYFFSYDEDSPLTHKKNKQLIFDDLLTFCAELRGKSSRM